MSRSLRYVSLGLLILGLLVVLPLAAQIVHGVLPPRLVKNREPPRRRLLVVEGNADSSSIDRVA